MNLTQSLSSKWGKHLGERLKISAVPFEVAGRGQVFKVEKRALAETWGKGKSCHVLRMIRAPCSANFGHTTGNMAGDGE